MQRNKPAKAGVVRQFQHVFYSGMSSTSDLLGALDAGVDIGVVAGRLPGFAGLWSLMRHLERGGAVFIDSGAFGERTSNIEPDWESVLSVYEHLAEITDGPLSRLYVVAPDKVGDQGASLARLRRYRDRIRSMMDAGVQVIVPYQTGSLGGSALHRTVLDILQSDRFIVGVPSNRDAMPATTLSTIEHHAYHFLGRVRSDANQAARLEAIAAVAPHATLTADAAWILSRMRLVCDKTHHIKNVRRQNPTSFTYETARRAAIRQMITEDTCWVP